MTSRRSRLKAVANLPARRKFPVQGSSNEVPASDTSSSLKSEEIVNQRNNICQDVEVKKSIPVNDVQSFTSCNEQDTAVGCVKHVFTKYSNTTGQSEELIDSTFCIESVNVLANNNEINEKSSLNSSDISSFNISSRSKKYVSPNSAEKSELEVSHKFSDNQSLLKEFVSDNSNNSNNNNIYNNINCDSLSQEGIKCYTVLSENEIVETSVSTITTLSPCETSTFIDVNANSSEFEEIQIYTELVEPTEIFVNDEPNKNNNFVLKDCQTALTTPVRKNVEKPVDEAANLDFSSTDSSNLKHISQDIFVKPTIKNQNLNTSSKILESEGFSRNLVTHTTEKTKLGNATTPISQNNVSDSHSLNENLKKSVSSLKRKRSKCSDFTKKLADARKEFQKKYEKSKPDRSTLKMIDLIFYNPASNPMESKNKFDKRESSSAQGGLIQEMLAEEGVDEPESVDFSTRLQNNDENETENVNRVPVPQVKIGLNGEIILDEKSLVIETTDAKKGREDLQKSIPIFEDRRSKMSYYRGKTRKTRDWTDFETKRFYKALNTIGPDFSLMQKYFPKRSRLELKNKFKREERFNRNLIDKALNNPSEFDMTQLEKDLAVERKKEEEEVDMRLCMGVKEKQVPKKPRIKSSLLSREMMESNGEPDEINSNEVDSQKLSENEKNKKKKEINFIFKKFILRESEKQINNFPKIPTSSTNVFEPANSFVT